MRKKEKELVYTCSRHGRMKGVSVPAMADERCFFLTFA
jgi:hypothetical protein